MLRAAVLKKIDGRPSRGAPSSKTGIQVLTTAPDTYLRGRSRQGRVARARWPDNCAPGGARQGPPRPGLRAGGAPISVPVTASRTAIR